MNNLNIVWTAVGTIVLGLATLLSAWQGDMDYVVAFGLLSIASATLASREKQAKKIGLTRAP
jgi:hypothetical protein